MPTPYDLIVVSAARPHLLSTTLLSLLAHLPYPPARILVHDDARFPNRLEETAHVADRCRNFWDGTLGTPIAIIPLVFRHDDPPIRHGPALRWLLGEVKTEFLMYSQDDHEVIRPLPLVEALRVLEHNKWVNQIRFNKRATMAFKDTWQGPWYKKEYIEAGGLTLTVSDHWYFQTGLWRTEYIRTVVDLAWRVTPDLFVKSVEEAVNKRLDNGLDDPRNPDQRARMIGTFVWGPVGEDRFIRHIGDKPEDWAGDHARA